MGDLIYLDKKRKERESFEPSQEPEGSVDYDKNLAIITQFEQEGYKYLTQVHRSELDKKLKELEPLYSDIGVSDGFDSFGVPVPNHWDIYVKP